MKNFKREVNLKYLPVVILLIILLLSVSACFYSVDGKRVTAREGVEEVVYIYLEEKYGSDKEFKVTGTQGGGSTGVGMRTVYVSSNELPDDTLFNLQVDNIRIDNNKYSFKVIPDSDNYIEVLGSLSIRDEMLEHLTRKYKREFIPLSFNVSAWQNTNDVTYTLACYPQNGDPAYDYTMIKRVDEGSNVDYQDTFFGNIIRNEMEREIFDLLTELTFPYMVSYRVGDTFYDDSFNADNTLADLKIWLKKNEPDRIFEVDIVIWLQLKGDNDRGYMGESEPYIDEMYNLLRVLEHEYRFQIGIVYKEEFVKKMTEPTNVSVYHRSDMVTDLRITNRPPA